MKRVLAAASLLILLISGSACNLPIFATYTPKATAKTNAKLKEMLETQRHKLQRYQEELGDVELQISSMQGMLNDAESDRIFSERDDLKKKILQSRVNIDELEILIDDEH